MTIFRKIDMVFDRYREKLVSNKFKVSGLTEYEQAMGFTDETRVGSKSFSNNFGKCIEDILVLSEKFKLETRNKIDGSSEDCLYQIKSKYNTMKQSMATSEIAPMLKMAIDKGKKFKLIILSDKNNSSRNIPLHEGEGLKKIQEIKGYNPKKHRWISGDCVYSHLFPIEQVKVKNYILGLLSSLKK